MMHASEGSAPTVTDWLASLEAGLTAIDQPAYHPELFRAIRPELMFLRGPETRSEAVGRRALRALMVVGWFSDLPSDVRESADVQRRMHDALPELDTSVRECADALAAVDGPAASRIQSFLREDAAFGDRVADALADIAGRDGVSTTRTQHLRQLLNHVSWRLREHDPRIVAESFVGACSRAERFIGASRSSVGLHASGEDGKFPLHPNLIPSGGSSNATSGPPARSRAGRITLGVGGVLFGISLVAGAGSMIALNASHEWNNTGLILGTVAALGLIATLIVSLIGGIVVLLEKYRSR